MSWCERVFARAAPAMLLLVALAGCGFHPLYGEQTTLGYDPTLASVEVRPVPDRVGQLLVEEVREELDPRGAGLKPRYILVIGMTASRSDLGIRRDNTSTRGELTMNANLTLNDANTHAVVFRNSIRSTTSFNEPDDAYAATVAEDHAREEAASDLGREIAERVTLYFRTLRARNGT